MKKLFPLGLLAAAVSFNAQAYQFEAGVGLLTGSTPGNDDFTGYVLAGTAYFDDVSTETGPLAEAAFLQKASDVSLLYGTVNVDEADVDVDVTELDVRYVFKNDWLVEVGLANEDADGDEEDTTTISVGKYLSDNSEIKGSFAQLDTDAEDFDVFGVSYKNLMDMEGDASLALEVGLALLDGDDNSDTEITAGATYYLNKKLGVGAVVELLDGDSGDGANIGFDVSYFVKDNIELTASYLSENFEPDGASSEENYKTLSFAVVGRF